ncbi:MAG TPA: hypothetical protein VFT57_07645 [Gemmatimonadaceae bacterium]|nr:hypothetical protein [Gemmatimonadaceae bacterium]
MTRKRESKIVLWQLMSELEEAGEEDICSLLNQLMGAQPYFGSGLDLAEYLGALATLEAQGELIVRQYRIENGHYVLGHILVGSSTRPPTAFVFDAAQRVWTWESPIRQMVEVPDE